MKKSTMLGKEVYVNTIQNYGLNGTLVIDNDKYIELIVSPSETRDVGKRVRVYTGQIHLIRFDS